MGFADGAGPAVYSVIPPAGFPTEHVSQATMNETADANRSNRRITARKACLLTVRYRANGDWRPATAMDLSPYGCRLRVGEDIPRGAEVAVMFEAPVREGGAKGASVEVPGRAIWGRLEGLSFQVGVHFEKLPAALLHVLSALS
jgi:hypothetical protein